ncbi:putative c2 domain protein [Leishmania infantum JPCM5]|uniref:C2_domain_protein_-_putative n=2 Tax=Leishmania infantum TaxID=5671 RepID=A0A6L0XVN9_LEIIN|nr:putative c2 domain protein [Leishmania infantum JPCM5]CAC9518136.1 c2_domain_protein_-_putative [Leishmania infantum]CAM70397.1 putative c2 domain protein [Leishmania infantum JPCM5]SUZ44285.1 c2_domain_protein_-_putative [Leishmania infantum]|eukprot:XP_001467341.1 putative c2 domain protein [Leishmania infantum JPCM5]
MGRLEVCICGARNIGDTRKAGAPDPYVKVVMGDRKKTQSKYKTKVASSSLHPVWNEVVKFQVADYDSEQIVFELWNNNVIVDDLMGAYALSLNGLTRGVVSDLWVILKGTGLSSAELHLQALAVDFGVDPQPSSMVVRSIEEYNAAAATKHAMNTTELKQVACADDLDCVQKPSSSEPAIGIPLQAQVALPPKPQSQPFYTQQPTYAQQAQPPPHPIYYQQAPLQGSYYGAPPQPPQCMYGPSPI